MNPFAFLRSRLAIVASLALLAAPATAQGVQVGVRPTNFGVALGATFDVELDVLAAGSGFNAFSATVRFDTTAVRFVPQSPTSLQYGCLMTGGCSSACGNYYPAVFTYAGDSVHVELSLLCNQIVLTGPGQVYKLRFQAVGPQQVTTLHLARATFINAGILVNPVTTSDATIGIGIPLAVDGMAVAGAPGLRVQPNPAHGPVQLAVASPVAGPQALDVLDVAGRLVRHVDAGWQAAGARTVAWDGRGAQGEALPAGLYLVRLAAAGRVVLARAVLLP